MPDEQQEGHANRLKEARRKTSKNPIQAAKSIVSKVQLAKYINPFMDWLYAIALSVALLKDILDLVGIGMVFALLATITIWSVMIITGSAFKAVKKRRLIMRYGVLGIGTFVEMVFGIAFLPIETAMVTYVFISALKDRRDAEEIAEKKAAQQSGQTNLA